MLDTINMAKQLSGEYKEAFEWADMYSIGLERSEGVRDEKMMELYDLLLEAEHNEKSVEKIVGNDLEIFCKNFFEENIQPSRIKILLAEFFSFALVIFVCSVLDFCWEEDMTNVLPIAGGIAAGILANAVLKYFLHPIALKKKLKRIPYTFIGIGIWVCIVVAFVIIIGSISYELEIGSWILLIASGSYLLIYLIANGILRYRDHGNIFSKDRAEKKEVEEFNKQIENASLIEPSVKGMAAEFKRIRKRRQRKGIDYTFAEYAVKVRKVKEMNKWVGIGVAIFAALLVLGPSIDMMLDGTFWEGLFFMVIMAVVEFFICRFCLRSGHNLTDLQIQIIDECETRGIDILQYQEELQKTIDE